jgi:hypothetical protein
MLSTSSGATRSDVCKGGGGVSSAAGTAASDDEGAGTHPLLPELGPHVRLGHVLQHGLKPLVPQGLRQVPVRLHEHHLHVGREAVADDGDDAATGDVREATAHEDAAGAHEVHCLQERHLEERGLLERVFLVVLLAVLLRGVCAAHCNPHGLQVRRQRPLVLLLHGLKVEPVPPHEVRDALGRLLAQPRREEHRLILREPLALLLRVAVCEAEDVVRHEVAAEGVIVRQVFADQRLRETPRLPVHVSGLRAPGPERLNMAQYCEWAASARSGLKIGARDVPFRRSAALTSKSSSVISSSGESAYMVRCETPFRASASGARRM